MFTITSYTVEVIKDPFGILSGQRYEFLIDIEVEEDDELYSESGLYIRAIYNVDEDKSGLLKYELYEKTTQIYLDFDLEDDEVAAVEAFCKAHVLEADDE
ncbi:MULTISPECIES: DUF6509 family protein [Paenibacillus]|uniref:DUF6509 family protein n=3 Tax=Paenibacillus TaxID=44249 RepID=A0ABU3RIC0_9BACL|nr:MULTISPECIES: DUF6509 family protein [Paenibacillus]MBA2939900.1 pullulanase [Paenibacillus sp. CGMCC 1.16610]MCY9656378.1 DUF6509 family protein [Paenibacillus anseongense]MDU0204028.1 DUF6509 family protein [Paenibacillus sp. PFR10]MEB4799321.1 DUF6509 family protein [Paenibacillus chondroitinus]MEC0268245.1 DUF6509 family protein [Paenibacillus anseongense]